MKRGREENEIGRGTVVELRRRFVEEAGGRVEGEVQTVRVVIRRKRPTVREFLLVREQTAALIVLCGLC